MIGYYIAFCFSVIYSVLMHMRYTFRTGITKRRLLGFFSVYLFTVNVGGFVVAQLINTGVGPRLAGLAAIGVITILNFVGMKAASRLS